MLCAEEPERRWVIEAESSLESVVRGVLSSDVRVDIAGRTASWSLGKPENFILIGMVEAQEKIVRSLTASVYVERE